MPNTSNNSTPPRDSIAARIRSLLRPRNGSRAHLVPYFAGAALAIIVIAGLAARVAHHPTSMPAPAATVAAPAPVRAPPGTPAAAPITAPLPSTRPRVVTGHPAPAVTRPAAAGAPVAAQAVLTPPAGLVAGHLTLTKYVENQYNQYAQVSRETIATRSISVAAAASGSQASREVWTGWVHMLAPSTVVQVAMSGTGGRVAVDVDGTALGEPQTRGADAAPDVMDYSLPLAAGWHHVRVVVTSFASISEAINASVAFGNGVAAPAAATPYAVPQAAPVSAPAAAAQTPPAAAPKPVQTHVKPSPASTVGAH